jgi:hypothetical protein
MYKFLLVTAVLATIAFLLWRHNHQDNDQQNNTPPVPKKTAMKTAKQIYHKTADTLLGTAILGPLYAPIDLLRQGYNKLNN